MRARLFLLISLTATLGGCVASDAVPDGGDTEAPDGGTPPRTVASLWADPPAVGPVVVGPARVVSGRTIDRARSHVQDPVTGDGVEVRLGGVVDGWPPPVGTDVRLTAYWAGAGRMWIDDPQDVTVLGSAGDPMVAQAPEAARPYTLATWPRVAVRSAPDPAGRADLDLPWQLDGRFGVDLPGVGNVGRLTGLVTEDGGIAPRSEADWRGGRAPGEVEDTTMVDVVSGGVRDGATVRLSATQATPWSRDRRWVVVQDGDVSLWVDAEGYGDGLGRLGERGVWTGEVRTVAGLRVLRTWWPRELTGEGVLVENGGLFHGALVERVVTGLGPPDALGLRSTDQGIALDDRFRTLDDLTDPVRVRGAVDATGQPVRLAVVAIVPDDTGVGGDTGM